MKEIELQKKAEELERTLDMQLKQLKKDSEVWLKIGGAILVIVLISYGVAKAKRRKRHGQDLNFDKEEQEVTRGSREWKKRPAKKSSFLSALKKRLFLTLLSYGEVKLVDELNRRRKNAK